MSGRWRGAGAENGPCGNGALRTADGARQIEICVVKHVVGLGAELNLQALDGRVEALVEIKIGFVEKRRAAWIA